MAPPALDILLASEHVQIVLPDLDSGLYYDQFYQYNGNNYYFYPRSSSGVIERLIAVGISIDNHEKFAGIWKTGVSFRNDQS
jgi:hypothetical protein